MLAQGGWVFDGDDVVVAMAGSTATPRMAMDRVVKVARRASLPLDVVDREARYLRTEGVAMNDTLLVRLNVVVTDSATVEIAGQFAHRYRPTSWQRVSWGKQPGRGSGAWSLMTDVAASVGTIATYMQDPVGYDVIRCGGRRCDEAAQCRANVCRPPHP